MQIHPVNMNLGDCSRPVMAKAIFDQFLLQYRIAISEHIQAIADLESARQANVEFERRTKDDFGGGFGPAEPYSEVAIEQRQIREVRACDAEQEALKVVTFLRDVMLKDFSVQSKQESEA